MAGIFLAAVAQGLIAGGLLLLYIRCWQRLEETPTSFERSTDWYSFARPVFRFLGRTASKLLLSSLWMGWAAVLSIGFVVALDLAAVTSKSFVWVASTLFISGATAGAMVQCFFLRDTRIESAVATCLWRSAWGGVFSALFAMVVLGTVSGIFRTVRLVHEKATGAVDFNYVVHTLADKVTDNVTAVLLFGAVLFGLGILPVGFLAGYVLQHVWSAIYRGPEDAALRS